MKHKHEPLIEIQFYYKKYPQVIFIGYHKPEEVPAYKKELEDRDAVIVSEAERTYGLS